jgi:hypothetical protein
VKAKIDNVKAKSRTRRTEDLGQDPHWQDVRSSASWLHLRPVPYKRDPHDKSLPRTTTLWLQLVRGPWSAARAQGASTTTDARGGTIPHVMQVQQLAAMQAAHPDKSLNAGLTSCVAIPSPSSLALPHASSARGTQAPSTTRTRLGLGSGMPG